MGIAAAPARRAHCAACGRPQVTCLCAWVRPVAPRAGMVDVDADADGAVGIDVEVLILQHPMEVAQPKGTARLLHLSLPGSRLLVGETFDPQQLAEALAGPRGNLLLYPEAAGMGGIIDGAVEPRSRRLGPAAGAAASSGGGAVHEAGSEAAGAGLRLIVLDGTWRKSLKMLHANPALQTLPRLALQGLPPSRYAIRKAHRADQWSTLEATCAALIRLQGEPQRFDALLAAFDGFIAGQAVWLDGSATPQSPRSITSASDTPGGAS